jgi:probable HAF family extracellular repeat protein
MHAWISRFVIPSAVLLVGAAYSGHPEASEDNRLSAYRVTDLSSLGGTRSAGNSINNVGWVTGFSNLAGDSNRHAALWLHGRKFDLGTLGGPNSSVVWPVKNNRGVIVGIAQTSTVDPLGEAWSCSAFFPAATATGYTCLGFVWEWGVMRALPTLGGNNGFAAGANNRGQVVGWAENSVRDPRCNPPQVLQFHAVVWGPGREPIQQLPPFPGDSVGAATAINDKGQVVGISGICDNAVGRFSAAHAVLWENGTVTDIGNLGGVSWHTPMAINQRGDIVGFSNLPGDEDGRPNWHAFLWTKQDGIEDLGTLPGDVSSQALGINEDRQVVGLSCTAGSASCRAFLWQRGVMTDLKTLAPGYPHQLYSAEDINDLGTITGQALNPGTSERPAFMAIPIRRHGRDSEEGY